MPPPLAPRPPQRPGRFDALAARVRPHQIAALADRVLPQQVVALVNRVQVKHVAALLAGAGLVFCLAPFAMLGYSIWQESQLTQQWQSTVPTHSPAVAQASTEPTLAPAPSEAPSAVPTHSVDALFAIRVPKIGYYAAVRQGVSSGVLAVGPGHYPTTSLPGSSGLVGIAAHNTFWIPFGRLGAGDTVILETRSATYTYHVTGTRIVNPDDRTVLVNSGDNRLALTTCWPLWAGDLATQRLAIFAVQV